ncbi:MAG: hypothetical protein HYR88_05660, partial [Verrucomicrobia bacterium]|nr:hypothetical protein [Verrucomicrobiota bacterium]MBI3869398.1 hypothetical protein [Verrucomicrobiota bacterium]
MAEASHSSPAVPLEKKSEVALTSAALALDVSRDGRHAVAACQGGEVVLIDLAAARVEPLGSHSSYASGARFTPDGKTVISAGYDGKLLWHDVAARSVAREIRAHDFWSWDMDLSRDGRWVASATGRYEAGGYKYEPAPEREPCVRVFDAATGKPHKQLSHAPSTQAVAFSPNGEWLAAGNLMGEIRVWESASGKLASQWTTPDFTSWGIIKSHHYLGGVFALQFTPDGGELYACGMGPMVDPMAGNGTQRWQRFDWRSGKRLDQTHEGESGQGLMEALAFHPTKEWFVMAGRLFQGQWNLAIFDRASGAKLHAVDAKHRITEARFSPDGRILYLAKARQQEKRKDGKWPAYGLLETWSIG